MYKQVNITPADRFQCCSFINDMSYNFDKAGKMITEPVTLTPDQDGALQYPGLAE